MAETNTQLVVQKNGVLIPNELFGQNELVIEELKHAGVLTETRNGSGELGKHNGRELKPVRPASPIDLSREMQWLKKHGDEYVGQWVALAGDQLISHGTNAREVADAARAAGILVPFLTQVDPLEEFPFGGW